MILPRRRTASYSCWLLGGAVALLGCNSDSPEALIRSANQYIERNDSKAAVIQLKTALQKEPNSAEARYLLGKALLDAGDAASAEVELRKAQTLKHPEAAVIPALARAMVLQGQFQKLTGEFAAVELTDVAAAADLLTSLALGYSRQGKGPEATAALASALSRAPQYARARLVQARFKAESRDVDGAFALISDILGADPRNQEAWQLKGDLLYFAKRDVAGALEAHRESLKIRGDLASSHASILSILLAQQDVSGARSQLAELRKIAPNQLQTKYFEAELARLDKDFKTAREISQQLLRTAPDHAPVLQLAAAIALDSGSNVQAETFLAKALLLAPEAVATRRLLARTYVQMGHADKALEVLRPLLQGREPGAQTHALAGQAFLQRGDAKSAEVHFAHAAKLNPGDTGSRAALAMGQLAKGASESGVAQLQEISASEKGTVGDLALVSTHLRQGNFDGALKALDTLERKQPNTPLVANLRGMIHLTRKEVAPARKSFERALAIDPAYFPAVLSLTAIDLAEKKPEEAKKRLEAVLAVDPKHVHALLALVSLRTSAGASREEVIGLLSNAVRLNPAETAPRLLLIDAYMKGNDLKSALAAAHDGVAAQPGSAELRDALGRAQQASGDINQAIISLAKLAEMQPGSPEPHLRLAELYGAVKSVGSARQSLKRALAIAPAHMGAQRNLIMLELSAGRPHQAMALARSVQKVPAREALGLLLAGDVEASQERWPAAAAAYRASLKLEDSSETAIKLHSVLLAANAQDDASKFAAGWTKRHPDNQAFLAYLGNAALWRQDYAAALEIYTTIVRLRPKDALALNNLAVIASKLKMPEALSYAERADTMQRGEPVIMDTLAMILADSGQVDKAIELEKRAVELRLDQHKLRLNLAKLYVRAGQKSLARTELERLAKLGDQFAGQGEVARMLAAL